MNPFSHKVHFLLFFGQKYARLLGANNLFSSKKKKKQSTRQSYDHLLNRES